MITYVKYEKRVLVIQDIQTYIFRSFSSHVEMDHCRYGLQWKQELALKYVDIELFENTYMHMHT